MSLADQRRVALPGARLLVSLVGLAAIAWAVSVYPVFRLNSEVARIADRVISGDRFRNDVWNSLDLQFKNLPHESIKPSSLGKLAVIGLRGAEIETSNENAQRVKSRLSELTGMVEGALRNTPGDGFLWLTLSWISERSGANPNDGWRYLRSSYRFSPNEGWIGLKRSPFALGQFATLPDDIAENAVQELMHLVRSGLHAEAAEIIAGPGLSISKLLLRRLRVMAEVDRVALARNLSNRDGFEDAAKDLGVEQAAPRR